MDAHFCEPELQDSPDAYLKEWQLCLEVRGRQRRPKVCGNERGLCTRI